MNSPDTSAKVDSAAPTSVAMVFAERAREVTEFCLARGGKAFADWPVPTLYVYVFFHIADGTCFVVREHGRIAGVLFAQALSEADQRQRVTEGQSRFNWTRSADQTDAIALREVVATQRLLPRLVRQAQRRWPDWRARKVFTFREGQLVHLRASVIQKFLGE